MKTITLATILASLFGLIQTTVLGEEAHRKVMIKKGDVTLSVNVDALAEGQSRTATSGGHTMTVTRTEGRLAVSVDGKALELPEPPPVPPVPMAPDAPRLPEGLDALVLEDLALDGDREHRVVFMKRMEGDAHMKELEERIKALQQRIQELEAQLGEEALSE